MDRTERRDTDIEKQVLSHAAIRQVPIRALPACDCNGQILIFTRTYGTGEHYWLECGTCFSKGTQAVSKGIIQYNERIQLQSKIRNRY